jgi:hypothetical protein
MTAHDTRVVPGKLRVGCLALSPAVAKGAGLEALRGSGLRTVSVFDAG